MKVIALLTGRGNNTLKDKNLIHIQGKPALYYPANAARKCGEIDNWFCSSDDKEILRVADQLGYIPILRPSDLSTPHTQHEDVIVHALDHIRKQNCNPEILVVLLANNVTIKSEWISECIIRMRQDASISSVVPVYQDNDHHPLRAKRIDTNGSLFTYIENSPSPQQISSNRQDLPKCYFLAHNFWVLNVQMLEKPFEGEPPWRFMGKSVSPYIIDKPVDLHEQSDVELACRWVKDNYID